MARLSYKDALLSDDEITEAVDYELLRMPGNHVRPMFSVIESAYEFGPEPGRDQASWPETIDRL